MIKTIIQATKLKDPRIFKRFRKLSRRQAKLECSDRKFMKNHCGRGGQCGYP